jgi:hypothetical protein
MLPGSEGEMEPLKDGHRVDKGTLGHSRGYPAESRQRRAPSVCGISLEHTGNHRED